MQHEAYELLAGTGPVLITCEHASLRLPDPWAWPPDDHRLVGSHWSYDLGAEDLSRQLNAATGWPTVLARFSRLLIDANRQLDSPELCRRQAGVRPVRLNQGLHPDERQRRIDGYWTPYHDAIDKQLEVRRDLVAIHSFTDVYERQRRTLEIGVLFNHDEPEAHAMAEVIADAGYRVRLNEPYTGKGGDLFSADVHAQHHGCRALELEIRQDLLLDPTWTERFLPTLIRSVHQALDISTSL
ncbi:MAG: putative N-formylglutamate amidohydrolase [Kiritimatiellia bacterium]|jgi:predicted N-formylglutamate amidohydrolase